MLLKTISFIFSFTILVPNIFHTLNWIIIFYVGASYDSRICLQESNSDAASSQSVKGEEELSRVYQTLSLPTLPREDNNSNNRWVWTGKFKKNIFFIKLL